MRAWQQPRDALAVSTVLGDLSQEGLACVAEASSFPPSSPAVNAFKESQPVAVVEHAGAVVGAAEETIRFEASDPVAHGTWQRYARPRDCKCEACCPQQLLKWQARLIWRP